MAHEPGKLCHTNIEKFSVSLGRRQVLTDIDLHLHCGEITAIIGTNGAGKTTFLRALIGLIPHTGTLAFEDAQGHPARKPVIGYVPQRLDFDRMAPGSVVDLFCACTSRFPAFLGIPAKVRVRAQEALDAVEAPHLLHATVGKLSGGELQRVLLALALTPMPDMLLLDEPVSGVDARGLARFYQTVDHVRKCYDLTCIWVSHDLPAVRHYADRAVLFGGQQMQGRIAAQGKPERVFQSEAFHTIFGQEVEAFVG